jgi:hypothetical protein
VPASNSTIYPDQITKVWANLENPVTIAVGNDTLSYGVTTALGSTLTAGQTITVYSTVYIRTAADGAVNLTTYDDWDFPGNDVTEAELELLTETPLNVKSFGAVGDGVTDDSAAFNAAIQAETGAMNPLHPQADPARGPHILIPPGTYRIASTILIDRAVILEGSGAPGWFGNTVLYVDAGVTGIKVDYDGSTVPPRGDWSIIKNFIMQAASKSGTTTDGIQLDTRAHIFGVYINGFARDGVHIDASNPDSNANLFYLERVKTQENGRHGTYTKSGDANGGTFFMCDSSHNTEDGFHEEAFLGNNYIACHTASNEGRGYHKPASQAVNRSLKIGCYTESGQGDDDLWTSPAMDIGGVTENFVRTNGPFMVAEGELFNTSPVKVTTGDATDVEFYVQLGDREADNTEAVVLRAKLGTAGGTYFLRRSTDTLRWVLDGSLFPMDLTLANHADPGKVQFPTGFYLSTGADAAKVTVGSGSPEGVVTAKIGSLYSRLDGGANTTLYVKESGSSNTGWVAK